MAWYSSKRATTVIADGEHTACIYHQTKVVRWNDNEIILDAGGYFTTTTKTRMNEVSEHYGLGFSVFQKDGNWFVRLPSHTSKVGTTPGPVIGFHNGMKILR